MSKKGPLYQLLKLKGTTIRQVAKELGVEYCSMKKVLRGTRKTARYQQAWADYFGVSRSALFGPESKKTIRYLVEREISKMAVEFREELRRQCL